MKPMQGSQSYAHFVEDMFSVIMHIIQSYISMRRGRYLAH